MFTGEIEMCCSFNKISFLLVILSTKCFLIYVFMAPLSMPLVLQYTEGLFFFGCNSLKNKKRNSPFLWKFFFLVTTLLCHLISESKCELCFFIFKQFSHNQFLIFFKVNCLKLIEVYEFVLFFLLSVCVRQISFLY